MKERDTDNRLHQEVPKKELLKVFLAILVMLVLFWFVSAGHFWAAITFGAIILCAKVAGLYAVSKKGGKS